MKLTPITLLLTFLFLTSVSVETSLSQTPSPNVSHSERFTARGLDYQVPLPKEGLVPDKETAIEIAEVVLFRLYGKKAIIAQRPYNVKEEDYMWWISGTIKKDEFGFAFTIAISKHTAAVLHLTLL